MIIGKLHIWHLLSETCCIYSYARTTVFE